MFISVITSENNIVPLFWLLVGIAAEFFCSPGRNVKETYMNTRWALQEGSKSKIIAPIWANWQLDEVLMSEWEIQKRYSKVFQSRGFVFVFVFLFLGKRKWRRKLAVPIRAELKVAESARKNSFSYRFCFDVFFFSYIFSFCVLAS